MGPACPSRVLVFFEQSERSRYFETALPALRDDGVSVSAVSLRPPGDLHRALAAQAIPAYSLGVEHGHAYPAAASRLVKLSALTASGLIHAHEAIPASIAAAARRIARVPVLFHRHHAFPPQGFQQVFSRVASRWSTHTLAVSRAAARAAVTADHVRPTAVTVALNGVPPLRLVENHELEVIRDRHRLDSASPILLVVARLRPEKGVDVLLDAVPHLARLAPPPTIVVVGEGPEGSALRRYAHTIARDTPVRIHFVGFQHDIAPWYRIASAILVPSRSEPFGLVAVEGLAAGRPVVASDVEGLSEIITSGETGLLVPPGEPLALAGAIEHLLSNKRFSDHIAARGHEQYLDRFTVAAMIRAWLAGYERTMRVA